MAKLPYHLFAASRQLTCHLLNIIHHFEKTKGHTIKYFAHFCLSTNQPFNNKQKEVCREENDGKILRLHTKHWT